jgi:hypothetical protein
MWPLSYGREIVAFIVEHGHPAILAVVSFLIAIAVATLYFWPQSGIKSWPAKISGLFS